MIARFFIVLIIFVSFPLYKAYAEGSQELGTNPALPTSIILSSSQAGFAGYSAATDRRLNIKIQDVGEVIYFGFECDENFEVRLKDPTGAIVFGPQVMMPGGQGWINTHNQVMIGPQQLYGGGYNALAYTTTMVGDHYLEFRKLSATPSERMRMWDVTVATASGNEQNGRIWSTSWGLDGCFGPTSAKFYIYTSDSLLSTVDLNGSEPCGYNIVCNSFGATNTGNPLIDRMSKTGGSAGGEYKIFLNLPDPNCFPEGNLVNFTAPTQLEGCAYDSMCIDISINKPTKAEIILDLNGTAGYQQNTEDVQFLIDLPNSGTNCVKWDGKDGLGNFVAPNTTFNVITTLLPGEIHFPYSDAENNANGLIVESLSIPTYDPLLFWDDSNLGNGSNLTGCLGSTGCHTWNVTVGDNNTLNTWWYAVPPVSSTATTALYPLPTPQFNFTEECLGSATQFTDMSTLNGGIIANWEWDFQNDGMIDTTVTNPTFNNTYSSADTYTAKLIITTDKGCKDSITKSSVIVNPLPIANFTSNNVCLGSATNFVDLSVGEDISWVWDINLNLLNDQNPTFTYTDTGKHMVNLIVIDGNGCSDDTSKTVTVHPLPVANFEAINKCVNDGALSFTDLSTVSAGTINNWDWDFGDNNTVNNTNPQHIYQSANTYNVSLTVESSMGCLDDTIKQIAVFPKPTVSFSWDKQNGCTPVCADFTDLSTINSGTINAWNWKISDGRSNTIEQPNICFNVAGKYGVELVAVSDKGCRDSLELEDIIEVWPLPKADFLPSSSEGRRSERIYS